MNVDQTEVPAHIQSVWREWLLRSADKMLQRAMLALPAERRKGFRDGKWPRDTAIDRLLAEPSLTPTIRDLLQASSPTRALTAVLSEEALAHAQTRLVQVLGRDALAAALLIDAREPVRQQGHALATRIDQAEGDHPASPDAVSAALVGLRDDFRPFLSALGYPAETDASPARAPCLDKALAGGEKNTSGELAIARLQSRLDAAQKAEARANRELKAALSDKKTLADNLDTASERLANSHKALKAAEQAHEALKASIDSSIDRGIEERVNARLHPWLGPAEQLATAVTRSNTAPLLERARDTLARQAANDRRYGLWSQLHAECEALKIALDSTRTAEHESLRPLPELRSMQSALQTRISELQALLGIESAGKRPDGTLTTIAQRINQSVSIDQLASIQSSIKASADLGVLFGQVLSDAFGLVNAAFQRCYDQTSQRHGAPLSRAAAARTPFLALRACLEHRVACTVIIDGHNCLFALRELLDLPFDGDRPAPGACQHFANRLAPMARRHRLSTMHLWYDSHTASIEPIEENLRIHYSGGQGHDRADDAIVSYLQSLRHTASRGNPGNVFVVTADREESAQVEARGAWVVAPEEFLGLLI